MQTPQRPHGVGRPRSGRMRFWLGFAVGFALLALVSCGGVALSLGFGDLTLADLRGGGSDWTPPTLIPAPEAPLSEGGSGVESGRLSAGMRARNITGTRVNVRSTPGHLGKSDGDVLMQLEPGDEVTILGETALANGLTWHRVAVGGVEGWVAQATAGGVQILGLSPAATE